MISVRRMSSLRASDIVVVVEGIGQETGEEVQMIKVFDRNTLIMVSSI